MGVPGRAHHHRRGHGRPARRGRHAVLALRAPAARRAVPDGDRARRDEDRARPSRRRLHRDAPAQPVLRGEPQGNAGPARVRQRRARRDPPAGVRARGRGRGVRQGVRAAGRRLLLPGVRRPGPAAPAGQAAAARPRARAPGREEVDARRARATCAATHLPGPAPEPAGRRFARGPRWSQRARARARSRCGRSSSGCRRRACWWIGRLVGEIGAGLLVFLGVTHGDDEAAAALPGRKGGRPAGVRGRRRQDEPGAWRTSAGPSSPSPSSRFTAIAARGGGLPSTGPPGRRSRSALYGRFVRELRALGLPVATGEFQAHMQVELVNDGPVTLMLEREPAAHRAG